MRVTFKITGANETVRYLKGIESKFPYATNEIGRNIATDVARGTRMRIINMVRRTKGIGRTGNLLNSVKTNKVGNHWNTSVGGSLAPYARVQEFGKTISGYHFVPNRRGRHAEGVSAPGGSIRVPAHYFFTNSVETTRSRAKKIAKRTIDRLTKEGG